MNVNLYHLQCSLLGGEFRECESACRNDPFAEICTAQCVIVCSVDSERVPEFGLTYSKEGGFAGISQTVEIDTTNNFITISDFNSDTKDRLSKEEVSSLWNVISENSFFELERLEYPPTVGSADYFTYSLDVVTSAKRNTISWNLKSI